MALNIKQLNSDSSFLLTLEPVIPDHARGSVTPRPFTILLDPWLTGPSKILHSKISITTHKYPACVSSVSELPEPDLVIISQHKSDHCNEATLLQLPATGSKTLILAEPAAARLIRSWRHFDRDKVQTLERWEDPRLTGKHTTFRMAVPPVLPGSKAGEVTVALVPQKRDRGGIHNAIGITYRPPATNNLSILPPLACQATPPVTPTRASTIMTKLSPAISTPGDSFLLPPSPPISPTSPESLSAVSSNHPTTSPPTGLRSVRSATTLATSTQSLRAMRLSSYQRGPRPSSSHSTSMALARSQPLSIIFSPHGVSYSDIVPYATSHLVQEAALPLTTLLHCMDSISNPWWLGGNVTAGAPSGAEIAARLGAKVWISAHDGEKDVRGLATSLLRTKTWDLQQLENAIGSTAAEDDNRRYSRNMAPGRKQSTSTQPSTTSSGKSQLGTEIMRLNSGDEVLVSEAGLVWHARGAVLDCQNEQSYGTKPGLRYEQNPEKAPPSLAMSVSKRPEKSLRLRTKTSMSALSRKLWV